MITNVILLAALAILCLALGVGNLKRPRVLLFGNIAEGCHPEGRIGKLSDAAITSRYLLGKAGSDADHVAVCGASDVPLCIIEDEASAAELPISTARLGATDGTSKMVASEAIAVHARLVPAASGQVKALPAAAGTYWVVGRAEAAAAAAGDEFEVTPCFPHQVTVT